MAVAAPVKEPSIKGLSLKQHCCYICCMAAADGLQKRSHPGQGMTLHALQTYTHFNDCYVCPLESTGLDLLCRACSVNWQACVNL